MSLRHRFLLSLASTSAVAALAFGCTAPSDGTGSSANDISGSLSNAKACAVQDGYEAAPLSAFQNVTKADLPTSITASNPTSVARFTVAGVGQVWVVEENNLISFYDASGAAVARAAEQGSTSLTWYQPNNQPTVCHGASSSSSGGVDGGPILGDDDDDNNADASAPVSCLSTAPIDQSQFPYNGARAATAGACTMTELVNLSAYYKQHAAEDLTLTQWKSAVSASCGSCAFGDLNDAQWKPIIGVDDKFQSVNTGGCIEQVTGSQACGKAYQQYGDCTLQACLVSCTTQTEFTRCRQDQAVLSTSCKGAYEALTAACGGSSLSAAQTACRGTTYSFEGPIKVACVIGAPHVAASDAGAAHD